MYVLSPSPLWLHGISAVAVSGGALLVLRILQHLGASGVLAVATALVFILNDNTARALNYGFHPEVLYALIVPWMIYAGLLKARRSFLLAMCLCVLAVSNLCLYYGVVSPMLTGRQGPTYAHFWANYGETPFLALIGMLSHPGQVLASALTSPLEGEHRCASTSPQHIRQRARGPRTERTFSSCRLRRAIQAAHPRDPCGSKA